jgi:hypothetical protein
MDVYATSVTKRATSSTIGTVANVLVAEKRATSSTIGILKKVDVRYVIRNVHILGTAVYVQSAEQPLFMQTEKNMIGDMKRMIAGRSVPNAEEPKLSTTGIIVFADGAAKLNLFGENRMFGRKYPDNAK